MNYDRIILELMDRVSALEEEVRILKQRQNDMQGYDVPEAQEVGLTENESLVNSGALAYHFDNGRDTTKYMLDGRRYGKNRLVLAIVQKYALSYNCPTIGMLMSTFDKSLQGSLGVVRELSDVKNSYSDYERRFFCQPNEVIHTTNGDCVVCSQWGKFNIDNMVVRARELGMNITVL